MSEQRTSGGGLKYTWAAIVLIALVTWGWVPLRQEAHSQTPQVGGSSTKMEVVSTTLPSGEQQIVVIDVEKQAMAVYHVDAILGKVRLQSVRQLAWDLQMEQFNGQSPLPSEIRQMGR